MLQRADITGARPVILVEAATPAASLGDAKQEALNRLTQFALGKEFQAQVLSRLADGAYLVQIDDAVASMKLPVGTQTGDILDLTLLATEPRPTFLLGKPSDASTASLSQAGRLIANMLQLAQEDGAPPSSVIGRTPLVASPDAPAVHIASALRQAVTFSGLFYESHVAQWAQGSRPMAELMNEPPAKLLGSLPPPQTATTVQNAPPHPAATATELNKLVANVKQWMQGERALTELLQEHKGARPPMQDGTDASSIRSDAAVHAAGAKLLSLQLDTLEQQRIVWQGELFPGQLLEWEISDDAPRGNAEQQADDAARSWQSTVRFSLPTLGAVSATVRLSGDHVQVHVQAADQDAVATLRAHGGMLADALAAAGSRLDALQINHDG